MSRGFQFKQFYVNHEQSAMKVGTDSIVLGSWAPVNGVKRILDIGTGSGLLALMMAQKSDADCAITAIDIESTAVNQATFNFIASKWKKKFSCREVALQDYTTETAFDFIICNPPYFAARQYSQNDETTQNQTLARLRARQQDTLSLAELLDSVKRLLAPKGAFCCVLPSDLDTQFTDLAQEQSLSFQRKLSLLPSPDKPPIRSLWQIGAEAKKLEEQELIIKDDTGQYTNSYKTLTKDFYLHF